MPKGALPFEARCLTYRPRAVRKSFVQYFGYDLFVHSRHKQDGAHSTGGNVTTYLVCGIALRSWHEWERQIATGVSSGRGETPFALVHLPTSAWSILWSNSCAFLSPLFAALAIHSRPLRASRGMPSPLRYISPRLYCAPACPAFAAS